MLKIETGRFLSGSQLGLGRQAQPYCLRASEGLGALVGSGNEWGKHSGPLGISGWVWGMADNKGGCLLYC